MNRPSVRPRLVAAVLLALIPLPALRAGTGPELRSVTPDRQRVHDLITLRGAGFGSYDPAVDRVEVRGAGGLAWGAGRPYVWRDDFIQVRVPVGAARGGMLADPYTVAVVTPGGESEVPFGVLALPGAQMDFVERTRLQSDVDVSGILGPADLNMGRTKDADLGDIDGDGYPDLIDNNSNNLGNGTHAVVRFSQAGLFFNAAEFEPVGPGDVGDYLVTVPQGGIYTGDAIVYDADLVDLTNDGLPDWVQAASGAVLGVRVVINGEGGLPGRFLESTRAWFPNPSFPGGSPDDVCHTDVDHDGWVDVAVAFRFSNMVEIYLNDGGATFGRTITIASLPGASAHDVLFTDANADGYPDVIVPNESGDMALFLHDGNAASPGFAPDQTFDEDALAAISADLDGDGVEDFAVAGSASATVFLNDPGAPGSYTAVSLPQPVSLMYDLEAGDIDLDGDVDLVAAAINENPQQAARIWLNNGDGTFVNATSPGAGAVLAGIGPYQRLSADLVDFDMDGDLDLYLTGADAQSVFGFGMVSNQFWESRILGLEIAAAGACPGGASLEVTGATPSGQVALLSSDAPGLTTAPGGPCPGTQLGLAAPSLIRTLIADPDGNAGLAGNLAAPLCGSFLEAVDLTTCEASSVLRLP